MFLQAVNERVVAIRTIEPSVPFNNFLLIFLIAASEDSSNCILLIKKHVHVFNQKIYFNDK